VQVQGQVQGRVQGQLWQGWDRRVQVQVQVHPPGPVATRLVSLGQRAHPPQLGSPPTGKATTLVSSVLGSGLARSLSWQVRRDML
jgi:hypothetical protein